MAEAMLIGAGIGAGGALLSGEDPLKGAALGGAMGGMGGAMSSAPGAAGGISGATTAAANGSMTPTGSMFGGFGDTIGQGFDYMNLSLIHI